LLADAEDLRKAPAQERAYVIARLVD